MPDTDAERRPRGLFDLTGKVVLVTGGNAGIGRALAEGIADAGGDVIVWGRRTDRNEAAAAELRERGVRALAQTVDVADEARVGAALREAVEQLGRVDCVIANAGVNSHPGSFLELTTEAYHELLTINQHGAFYTLREGVRHMVARAEAGDPGGSLILCGSLAVTSGVPGIQHYAAAKGALASVVRGIAVEYGPHGIRANVVLPGFIDTDLGGANATRARTARRTRVAQLCPAGRYGTPVDLQGIAVYLASDASAYHTGDTLVIDGGVSVTLGV